MYNKLKKFISVLARVTTCTSTNEYSYKFQHRLKISEMSSRKGIDKLYDLIKIFSPIEKEMADDLLECKEPISIFKDILQWGNPIKDTQDFEIDL